MATSVIPNNYVKGHKVQAGLLTGTAIAIAAVAGFVIVQANTSTPNRAEVVTQSGLGPDPDAPRYLPQVSGPSSTLPGVDPQEDKHLSRVEVPEAGASSDYVLPEQNLNDAIRAASAAALAAEAAPPTGPGARTGNQQ